MKGIFYIIICITFSNALAQNQKGEIQLGLYNDSWGGGFTPIYDDLRTYHLQVRYNLKNKFNINARYSLLTNRFDEDTTQRISLDELAINASFSILRFKNGKAGNLSINAGTYLIGDLLGSQIQSTTHNIFGVAQTNLTRYKEKKNSFL